MKKLKKPPILRMNLETKSNYMKNYYIFPWKSKNIVLIRPVYLKFKLLQRILFSKLYLNLNAVCVQKTRFDEDVQF